MDQPEFRAEHGVRVFRVYIVPKGKGIELLFQHGNEFALFGQFPPVRDGGDDKSPFHFAHDDVPQRSAAGRFVKPAHAVLFHILLKYGNDIRRPRRMDRAALYRYDAVTAFRIKTDDRIAVRVPADGELQFVPVFELALALDGKRHFRFDPRDLAQGVLHRFALQLELCAVAQMLQLAAAAFCENGATGTHPFVRRGQNFERFGITDAAFDFERLEFDLFPDDGKRRKKHRFALMYDPFPVCAERLHRSRELEIFFRYDSFHNSLPHGEKLLSALAVSAALTAAFFVF